MANWEAARVMPATPRTRRRGWSIVSEGLTASIWDSPRLHVSPFRDMRWTIAGGRNCVSKTRPTARQPKRPRGSLVLVRPALTALTGVALKRRGWLARGRAVSLESGSDEGQGKALPPRVLRHDCAGCLLRFIVPQLNSTRCYGVGMLGALLFLSSMVAAAYFIWQTGLGNLRRIALLAAVLIFGAVAYIAATYSAISPFAGTARTSFGFWDNTPSLVVAIFGALLGVIGSVLF